MKNIETITVCLVAAGIGALAAEYVPVETRNYLLWKIPVTIGDSVGETYGIPSGLASVLIGLSSGVIAYLACTVYRKILHI